MPERDRASRASVRWCLWAVCFAGWCAASVWCVLAATLGQPGLIGDAPGRGAFDVFPALFGLSAGRAFALLFLACLLLACIVGGLRGWLDPQRQARRALRWAAGSAGLNLAACLLALLLLVPMTGPARVAVASALPLLCLALPFAAWNGRTLAGDRLARWWRPRWPGWPPTLLLLLVLLLDAADRLGAQAGLLDGGGASIGWAARLCLEALFLVAWLLVALAFIGRLPPGEAWRACRAMLRWHRLRAQLWQTMMLGTILFGLMMPVMAIVLVSIFALPAYDAAAQQAGGELPWPLRVLDWFGRQQRPERLIGAWLLVTFYAALAQGRLLVLLGAGTGEAEGGRASEPGFASGTSRA